MKVEEINGGRSGFKRLLPKWLRATEPEPSTISLQCRRKPLSGRRVLIVDDDAVVRSATSNLLRNHGFEVMTAADCSEAIGAIAQVKPDVILLDLSFPPEIAYGGGVSWDGLGLMFWLRGLKNAKGARFIIITGSTCQASREKALAHGVEGYLQKPIKPECLLEILGQE
jgi:CheY-like chemotaxis protein